MTNLKIYNSLSLGELAVVNQVIQICYWWSVYRYLMSFAHFVIFLLITIRISSQ